jgi:hypothetical protein
MSGSGMSSGGSAMSSGSNSEGRSNFSWLGLIGLAGLAGLMRKGNSTTDTRSSGIR